MAKQGQGPVTGHGSGNRGGKHHDGWNDAIQDALSKLPPGGGSFDVRFQAEVTPNPGHINEYMVVLDPRS